VKIRLLVAVTAECSAVVAVTAGEAVWVTCAVQPAMVVAARARSAVAAAAVVIFLSIGSFDGMSVEYIGGLGHPEDAGTGPSSYMNFDG
jgi:hypothetical protein